MPRKYFKLMLESAIVRILFSWRSCITFMCFLAFALHTVMCNVINVAQICMISHNDTLIRYDNANTCRLNNKQLSAYEGNLPWTETDLDHLIAVLGWGKLFGTLPVGLLSDYFDSAVVLLYVMLVASLSTLLFPIAALLYGYTPTLILRFIQGTTLGTKPCFNALIAHWSPRDELSSRLIFVLASQHLSNFLLNIAVARFCSFKKLFGGWPIGFLSSGILGLLWCGLWWKFGANNPEKHSKVSKKEKEKILMERDFKMEDRKLLIRTFPWKQAILSKASLTCLLCETTGLFGVACIVVYFPRYARDVLSLNMYTNGLVTAIPNLLEFICRLSFNFFAEYLVHSCRMDRTWVMKIFNTVGMLSMAILLYTATYVNCAHKVIATILIISAQGLYGATSPGFISSQVLIAPKYAGITAGWFSFISSASMIALPYLVAYIVSDPTNVLQWRIVFGMGSLAQLFSALIFLVCGSADEQSWSKSIQKADDSEVNVTRY